MKPLESLHPDYFARVYAQNPDPWDFETSGYEAEKYRRTLEALPPGTFDSGFEIGCSIGVLTRLLGARSRHLLAVDVSDIALDQARKRCRDLAQVTFERRRVPDEFPDATFDLIVVSEVGYYWSSVDLNRASRFIFDAIRPGGCLLLVHWTPPVDDYPLDGDTVHRHFEAIAEQRKLVHARAAREDRYRLDLFVAPA